jgi:hypothetical protein
MVNLYNVKTKELNIRSSPQVEDGNKIASIAQNQVVAKLNAAGDAAWWKILAIKDGQPIEGFVASRFLEPAPKLVQAIGWFKAQFRAKINSAVVGTPFSLDLLAAIAMQETYYIWGTLYPQLSVDQVLQLCVGDTLDTPKRSAFPKNKAELLAHDRGDEMFPIGRAALESVGSHIQSFKKIVEAYPDKFCRGYGIFQLDLQFFKTQPEYFLQKKWHSFDACLAQCIHELKAAMKRAYGSSKATLTDEEMVYIAIAYNRGSVDFSRKFKQGFHNTTSNKFYGEYIWEYLQLAKSVP